MKDELVGAVIAVSDALDLLITAGVDERESVFYALEAALFEIDAMLEEGDW